MRRIASALVVAAVALTGCGSDDPGGTGSAAPPATEAPSTSTAGAATPGGGTASPGTAATNPTTTAGREVAGIVPDAEVTDVAAGTTVRLRAALATDRPTLIWMWAPH